jgi:hypothetical protein
MRVLDEMFDFFGGLVHKHVLNRPIGLSPFTSVRNDVDVLVN